MKKLGIDIGSTTLKCVVLDENGCILWSKYKRHYSKIIECIEIMLKEISAITGRELLSVVLSGSAGMGIADMLAIPFTQEVYAERIAVSKLNPNTDVVIELGGEDAKILFLTGGFEMRMNGSCAGGTGAFIDQMASLMQLEPDEMNELASKHERSYSIASRCGVFAKADVQPLLNQGARKEDVSDSIYKAVVNQTIAGLAQGRRIKGNVLYLGGPLSFMSELRRSFDEILKVEGICPNNSLYYVAIGAALSDIGKEYSTQDLKELFHNSYSSTVYNSCSPLFANTKEYEDFIDRHKKASEGTRQLEKPEEIMYLGIDAGSTTVKMLLCDKSGNIFKPFYAVNSGNPIPIIKKYLQEIYNDYPEIIIRASAVTGYGEGIVKNAFGIDFGMVETVAHYTAAKKFRPDVDFILDIGGQDIKCFQIRKGNIDSIYLNEACSSGCGSFLQTFAASLGYDSEEFAKIGLFAKKPVDLGSRCTVFMNSSVKQAQKDGALVEDIAAGLSISVVKNALYKVIRCVDPESLGKNIVVQGGTFLNDSVLRAFEQEIGHEVIRPEYAAMMGAYGAALYSMQLSSGIEKSSIISSDKLKQFTHSSKVISCKGCGNHCSLTVNTFNDGSKYIAGNRCDRVINTEKKEDYYDLYEYKKSLLKEYINNVIDKSKRSIALPLGLNFYELLPFWYSFFDELGFSVVVSPFSDRSLYLKGQHTIPSDTVCYPAKLMHGHIEYLLDHSPDAVFYPDMSYNLDDGLGIDHFNCPVVAYYPQVLKINVGRLKQTQFICDFVSPYRKKQFEHRMADIIRKYYPDIKVSEIKKATQVAYKQHREYFQALRNKADEYLAIAKEQNKTVIVLAGRPYHVDPEINHGINTMLCKLGAIVITEDSISNKIEAFPVDVRNQWTYHSRLYAAAKYVANADKSININLVQLVSFGCGVDAITSDEVRAIIESSGKIYTQIKIDEISNMGAVNIRLRSLFSAIKNKEKN